MGDKRNKKRISRRKFNLAGGIASKKHRKERWLSKTENTDGLYWYCCPLCRRKFSKTDKLMTHQQNCHPPTPIEDKQENMTVPQLDTVSNSEALGKLTPEATPEKSTGPFVGGKGDGSQPTSTPASPDQNNFADMELKAMRAGILRAVGKEIGTNWQDVLESLDLDISMEDETVMEDRIEKSPSPGYKFLQLIGAQKLPGNERITVRQVSDALVESNQVLANDIMLGNKDSSLKIAREDVRKSLSFAVYLLASHDDLLQISSGGVWQSRELQTAKISGERLQDQWSSDRRFRSLHQSYSDASINQRQGAVGGGSVNRDSRVDNQQLNIEPFRSLPAVMKDKEKLDTPLTEPNNATNEALDNKESDNLSLQNFTHLNVPFTMTGIRSRKMNENSKKLSPDLNATDHSQLPKSKELDSVVKLRRRDISKRKLKPSWKLSEYLGIGDSATIDSTCNDDYAEKCSPLDDMTLEMEVVNVPTLIDESISQAQAPLDGRLSINKDTDIVTSNKGQESFAINDSINNINPGNGHIWLNSDRRDFQTTCNETVYLPLHQNYDGHRFEDEQGISSKDPCPFTEEKVAEEILQTKDNINDLSNRDMNSIHGSKQICVNNSSTPKANEPESDEYLEHLNIPSRGRWKRKSEPTLQIHDYTSSEDADKKAKKSPHSTEKNIDISQENHSKEVNATNTNIPKINQSEEVEIVAQLRYRDKGKRALKPTWKLSDNLSITKANKKVKRSRHSLEMIDTEVIIDRKDKIEKTTSKSGPQQNPSDLENQKAIVSAKINTDEERKLEIKRSRKQQKTRKLLHAKTLYSVTAGDSSNMYYLLKKKIKKPARNCTSLKKTDTVVNDTVSETIPVSVNLKDHPDSYCIEDFTDLARDSRGKSVEEKNCQRFLCNICNSYRTLLIDDLRQHIELHINGKLNCRTCNFIANSLYNLRCHINESHHESRGAVICELCGTFKGSSDSYKAHASKVHGIAVYKCSHCENAFHRIQALKEHKLTVHKSCAFQCDKCRGIFMSQNGLENHLKICVEKLYTCKYCNFARNSKDIVRMHVKTRHSKESTIKCSICTFSAVSKQQLTNHMNAHLGIHKYSCELCAFSCVKKYQLESHQRRHSGEKKFKCDKCCYAAAWNVQLKIHMKAHDSDTQCLCKVCGIVLKDKRCLKLHKKKDHSNASERPSGMSDE